MQTPNEKAHVTNNSNVEARATCESGNASENSEAKRAKTGTSDNGKPDAVTNLVPDWDNWRPYPPEFITYTAKLREIQLWFRAYNKAYDKKGGGELTACNRLDDGLIDCANAIAELASSEFVDCYFFNDNKEELKANIFINVMKSKRNEK